VRVGSKGYLLTGRHGLFNSYEAFNSDRRFDVQPARQVAEGMSGTARGAGRFRPLNYLLASHVWQQDHNGFTHQDPGFLDHVINKKADIVRVLPAADPNCLLSVFDHCLRSRNLRQRGGCGQARTSAVADHGTKRWCIARKASASGNGASNDQEGEPDV